MAAELKGGIVNMASFIEVEDGDHKLVETVSFSDAVQMESRPGIRPGR